MKNSRLVDYLQLLPPSKLKKLRQFLLLFLSEKAQPVVLFDALCKGLKKPKLLDHDYILNTAFKEKTRKASLHNATHKLLGYVENFLLNLQLHTDNKITSKNIERELLILKYLKNNKEDDLYFDRLDALINIHEKAVPNNIWHIYECMRLRHDAYYNKRDYTKNKIDKKGNIPSLIGSLDSFYEDFSGRYYLESLARSKIMQKEVIKPIFYKKNDSPTSLYWKLITLFESNVDDKLFQKIKIDFEKNFHTFQSKDQETILLYLVNYATLRTREDERQIYWAKNVFSLYDLGNNKNVFQKNGISTNGFCNAITAAASLEKIKWSKKFILKNKMFLPKTEKKSTLLFTNMYVLFVEKKYAELIELHYNQNYKDYQSEFRYKYLLLFSKYKSSLYSKAEITSICEREYNAMKSNTTFSEPIKKAATNFFNCIKALNKKNDSKSKLELKFQKKPLLMQFWLKKELKTYKARDSE